MTAGSEGARSGGLRRHLPLTFGLILLALLWGGPLPFRAGGSFAAYMMHMGVVAVAAPLLAFGIVRSAPTLASHVPGRLALLAAFVEFALVWGRHAPALHDAARESLAFRILEQGSFLFAGLFVWLTALSGHLGADRTGPGASRAAGVAGLLVTSMHMTLLGALLLLSPRTLYACADLCTPFGTMTPLEDQQLGGAIMLGVGGVAYLAGGLGLLASILVERTPGAGGRR